MARSDQEFVEFVEVSSTRLLHAAWLLTGNRDAAEDAVQTALARTYAAWPRVRRDDAFAYTRKVLINHLTDGHRRPFRECATQEIPEPVTSQPGLAEQVALRRWVVGALSALTPRERAVVVMRYLFDLPEIAVARDLGITVGTVKSTSSRALAKLRVSAELEPVRER